MFQYPPPLKKTNKIVKSVHNKIPYIKYFKGLFVESLKRDDVCCFTSVKTYEDMTLEELEDNEDEFGEEDEAAIEMYR